MWQRLVFYDAENHGQWACQSIASYFLNNPLSHINIKINISTLFIAHNVSTMYYTTTIIWYFLWTTVTYSLVQTRWLSWAHIELCKRARLSHLVCSKLYLSQGCKTKIWKNKTVCHEEWMMIHIQDTKVAKTCKITEWVDSWRHQVKTVVLNVSKMSLTSLDLNCASGNPVL